MKKFDSFLQHTLPSNYFILNELTFVLCFHNIRIRFMMVDYLSLHHSYFTKTQLVELMCTR
jgi:hypothetical protein